MFGFHPFSTQAFSEGAPFIDLQATTNLVSSALGSSTMVVQPELASTNLGLTAATSSPSLVNFALPSGVEIAAAINSVAPFTWAQVSDTTSETWSQVSDTGGQSWTQVDDTADQDWSEI